MKQTKKFLALLLALFVVFSISACEDNVAESTSPGNDNLADFHSKVSECQELLDTVADDIYSNWYDAIYEDKFNEDINTAILMAQRDNAENIEKIETLDAEITALFKLVKDTEQGDLVKDIMSAYSDYYEFVINVSGSFKSYSADKETLKKELASLLRDLSYEI
jgi:hypothetical protein